jgi:hypothetical protein
MFKTKMQWKTRFSSDKDYKNSLIESIRIKKSQKGGLERIYYCKIYEKIIRFTKAWKEK